MRTVFTVAAGLVATTSAANLRAHESSSSQEKAAVAIVHSLAAKYDCAVGGQGLDDVLDEIASKNAETQAQLELNCFGTYKKYNDALEVKEQKVMDFRTAATPTAEASMVRKIAAARHAHAKKHFIKALKALRRSKKAAIKANRKVHAHAIKGMKAGHV